MNQSHRLLEKLTLPNGLEVRFYDNSRKIAGDRWYVQLQVDIPIPIDEELIQSLNADEDLIQSFIQEKGNPFVYRYIKDRNFIDKNERTKVLEQMKKDFIDANHRYLAHPHFSKLTVKKAFAEWEERRRWWR